MRLIERVVVYGIGCATGGAAIGSIFGLLGSCVGALLGCGFGVRQALR